MGKRKWKRVKLADLANQELQQRLLSQIEAAQALDRAKSEPEADSPEKRPSETVQEGR
jgi:hypothetical protein